MNKIRELRKLKGVSQVELAEAMSCTQNAISRYENGQNEMPLVILTSMAQYFGVTTDELLGLKSQQESAPKPQPATLDERLVAALKQVKPGQVQRVLDFIAGMVAGSNE